MLKQFTTAALLLSLTGIVKADIADIIVSADTYIRNDTGGPNSKNDADADNEIIVGTNGGASAELNGLLHFDLSNLLVLGSPGDITLNSVTLTGTTRTGDPGQGTNVTLNAYDYGFQFEEADATYNDPDGDGAAGTGDTTPGGTPGTLLSTVLVADPGPSGQSIVFGDSANFRNAVSTGLAGDGTLNLRLTGTGANSQSFVRFDDEDRPNPLTLNIDYTVNLSAGNSIVETFEATGANNSSPPSGWILRDTANTFDATFTTTAAGGGSNGAGGNTGVAGRVSVLDFGGNTDISGGYLFNTTSFDMNLALTGSFDFQAVNEDTFDDITFMLGAIADGLQASSAGEMLNVKLAENSASNAVAITSGLGQNDRLDLLNAPISDDTWLTATVTWTPTSGTTGDFSITVSDFSGDLFTLSTTGFTFDADAAQIGFGSVNDSILFDNVNFNQVPEPGSLAVLGLGGLMALRRRRG